MKGAALVGRSETRAVSVHWVEDLTKDTAAGPISAHNRVPTIHAATTRYHQLRAGNGEGEGGACSQTYSRMTS